MTGQSGEEVDRPTVLVVEDDENVRELIRMALAHTGCRLLLAGSAAEATAAADGHRIDLLLTDVVLPGATGTEVAAALLAENPAMHVIYVTGWQEHVALADVPEGSLVQKPFVLAELARTVTQALEEIRGEG